MMLAEGNISEFNALRSGSVADYLTKLNHFFPKQDPITQPKNGRRK